MCPSSGENYCIYATLEFVILYGWRLVCWFGLIQPADQTPPIPVSQTYISFSPDDRHMDARNM